MHIFLFLAVKEFWKSINVAKLLRKTVPPFYGTTVYMGEDTGRVLTIVVWRSDTIILLSLWQHRGYEEFDRETVPVIVQTNDDVEPSGDELDVEAATGKRGCKELEWDDSTLSY